MKNIFHPRSLLFFLLALPLATGSVAAPQEGWMKPAPELAAFDFLLGDWEGSGEIWPSPDAEPLGWKATTRARKVLGGFWILEEMTAHIEGLPNPVEVMTVYGWDAEARSLLRCSLDSEGTGEVSRMIRTADDALISLGGTSRRGMHVTMRNVWRGGPDSWRIRLERAYDGGPTFTYATGAFSPKAPGENSPEAPPIALSPKLEAARPLVGNWRVEGWIIPMPGMPRMPLAARETAAAILGGHAIESRVVGDADESGMAFEGRSLTFWNEDRQCFTTAWFDGMGGVEISEGRPSGKDAWVMTRAGTIMGQPMVDRSVLTFSNGKLSSVYTDRAAGTAEPQRIFEATYSPDE